MNSNKVIEQIKDYRLVDFGKYEEFFKTMANEIEEKTYDCFREYYVNWGARLNKFEKTWATAFANMWYSRVIKGHIPTIGSDEVPKTVIMDKKEFKRIKQYAKSKPCYIKGVNPIKYELAIKMREAMPEFLEQGIVFFKEDLERIGVHISNI